MVWSQGLSPEQVIDPRMAYQGPWLPGDEEHKKFTDAWNGCTLEQASVVHWHGSRHAASKLELMQAINDQLGVPVEPLRPRPVRTIDVSHLP